MESTEPAIAALSTAALSTAVPARAQALRQGLPYGAVMATAGAAVMAARVDWGAAAQWLWGLALLQALALPCLGAWRYRGEFALGWRVWSGIGPAHEHTGVHTVALGLAVILSGAVAVAPSLPAPLLWGGLAVVWAATVGCVLRFTIAAGGRGITLRMVGGSWFLVPAALLGAAVASADVAPHLLPGVAARALLLLARGGAALGWLGYWAMAALAALRVRRCGLRGVPQAPWWIAMGCAGLAAGALGTVAGSALALPAWLRVALLAAVAVAQATAFVLLVPVLAGSCHFLACDCCWRGRAVWPPTFSTAVFALGALQTGALLALPWLLAAGRIAAWATLALWAATVLWNGLRWARRGVQAVRALGWSA